eukprot:scaffold77681_cov34-Prasinocladus_malaysianus.AAC.1
MAIGGENKNAGKSKATFLRKYLNDIKYAFFIKLPLSKLTTIVTPNPDERIVSEGVEVMAGAPINIIHCSTNRALHLEEKVYENDFGPEWEVSAFTATGKSKKNTCELASTGSIRSMIEKPMTNANAFAIVYAPPSDHQDQPEDAGQDA